MNKLKKALAALTTAALMAGTVAMMPASAENAMPMKGDLNGDGKIDVFDGVAVLISYGYSLLNQAIPASYNFGDNYVANVADINNDGKTDVKDAVYILKYYTDSLVFCAPDGSFMTIDEYYANGFDTKSLNSTIEKFQNQLNKDIKSPEFAK